MANKNNNLDKALLKYVPCYPQAPLDEKYHYYDNGILKVRPEVSTLIKSVEELREYVEKNKGKKIAVDTETTGLTYEKDYVVGFSVASDMYHGIYVPLRHQTRRIDKEQRNKVDENGNILYTKAGKPRTQTVTIENIFESEHNLPVKECLDLLYELMLSSPLVIMHNSEFDLTMLQQEGYDMMKCKTFDTTILTYLYDAENKGWNKLKEASKIVLGRHPMKFYEALGVENNFKFVDLDIATPYAASDACNTYGLYIKLFPEVKKLLLGAPKILTFKGENKPYNVLARDNELIRAFTDYYNRVNLYVNKESAIEYQRYIEETLQKVETEIYSYFDQGVFNLAPGSNEFKSMMHKFHIVTGALTEKGAPSYGKEGIAELGRTLENFKQILTNFKDIDYNASSGAINKRKSPKELELIKYMTTYGQQQFKMTDTANTLNVRTIEGIKCNKKELFDELKLLYKTILKNQQILQLIQKRSSLMKALNSYVTKLTEVDTCHMRYRLQGTASGRLSSGNGSKSDKRKNHYFIDLNAQNLTKPHSAYYKATPSDEPGNILGYKFELVSEEYMHANKDKEIIVEGSDPKNNIRNCFVAPEGRYILSLDYSAQEYLVLAILSGDHKMINNFKNGIDPHTATAYLIWGEENYDRQKRKKAKGANFLQNYMGGASTLAKNLNIPLEEAEEIIDKYKKGFFECIQWKEKVIHDCIQKQQGACYTLFGRPRQFKSRIRTSVDISELGRNGGTKDTSAKVYLKTGNGLMEAVRRRIVSHHIQSTCGDICRWDLIRLYRKYFKNRNPEIDFYTTVHDEINFSVQKEQLEKYAREIDNIMTITDFREDLPIRTSIDVGYTLGVLFPFEWEDETKTKLVPSRV